MTIRTGVSATASLAAHEAVRGQRIRDKQATSDACADAMNVARYSVSEGVRRYAPNLRGS